MNQLDMFDSQRYIKTDLIGNIRFKTVLFSYDYPRIFVCESESIDDGHFYLFLELDDDPNSFKWEVVETTLDVLNEINIGNCTLQDAFLGKTVYLASGNFESDCLTFKNIDIKDPEYQIDGELYLSGFCDMDETFDYHGLGKCAKTNDSNFVSVVFEGNSKIKTKTVLTTIEQLKNLAKNIDKSIDFNNAFISARQGSTVISFEFPNINKGTLFEGKDFDTRQSISKLKTVLETQSPSEILAITGTKNDKAIKQYGTFIKSMKESGSINPKIVFSSPDMNQSQAVSFKEDNSLEKESTVKKIKDALKNQLEVKTKDLEVEGILKGYLPFKNSKIQFQFSAFKKWNEIQLFTGNIDESLTMNSNKKIVLFRMKYCANIKVFMTIDKKGDTVFQSFKLMNLEEIGEYQPDVQLTID